jgi:hypothetical protein
MVTTTLRVFNKKCPRPPLAHGIQEAMIEGHIEYRVMTVDDGSTDATGLTWLAWRRQRADSVLSRIGVNTDGYRDSRGLIETHGEGSSTA